VFLQSTKEAGDLKEIIMKASLFLFKLNDMHWFI